MLLVNTVHDNQQHALSLPPAIMWPVDDPTISKCFLSVFDEKIICISAKCIDNKTIMEVSSIESFPLQTCAFSS